MPEILMRRTLAGFVPVDDAGKEALRRIPIGATVKGQWKGLKPRNERRLRWWWAGIGLVHDTLSDKQRDRWPTPESLHEAIKVRLGYCEISHTAGQFKTPEGTVIPPGTLIVRPGSIAFGRMSEEDFAALCDRFVDLVCTKVLPGVEAGELRRNIEGLVGLRKEAA